MRHMLTGENLGLVVPRRVELAGGWYHALVAGVPIEHVAVSLKTIDYLFPLRLVPDTVQPDRPGHLELEQKRVNLNPTLMSCLEAAWGQGLAVEDVFHYIYGVLYSETYREKYAEFLRRNFPRVPFTEDFDTFRAIRSLGKHLADLHLLRSCDLDQPVTHFEGEGENIISPGKKNGFRYEREKERVYINSGQYFEPVPLELWEYQIGGYQVLEKWLKDRRDRQLSLDEIKTYCKIATAVKHTIEIQEEIDALYPEVEADLLMIKT